jgi:D-ribose pyranose/furanose isomerase RbsD
VNKKPLSKDVISQWPEVLQDVEVRAVPLEYLKTMQIIFREGRVWEINIAKHVRENNVDNLEQHLNDLLEEYEDVIEHVEFQLDMKKMKKDVERASKGFLKRRKL